MSDDDYKASAKASKEAKLAIIFPVPRMTDQEHRDFSAESWRMSSAKEDKSK